jgi:hypothetical protein
MKLEMVGTGPAFGNLLNSSGYIVFKNTLVIIDCGDKMVSVYEKLLPELIHNYNITKVIFLITHLHPDHVAGLPSVMLYLKIWHNSIHVFVYGYDNTKLIKDIIKYTTDFRANEEYTIIETPTINIYNELSDGTLFIEFISNKHMNRSVTSFSYSLLFTETTQEGKNILYYSGDTNEFRLHVDTNSENFLEDVLAIKQLGYDGTKFQLYHEVAFYPGCGSIHTDFKIIANYLQTISSDLSKWICANLYLYHADFFDVIDGFMNAKDETSLLTIQWLSNCVNFVFPKEGDKDRFEKILENYLYRLNPDNEGTPVK